MVPSRSRGTATSERPYLSLATAARGRLPTRRISCGRPAIAGLHAAIFRTIYAGSTNRFTIEAVRLLRSDVALARVHSTVAQGGLEFKDIPREQTFEQLSYDYQASPDGKDYVLAVPMRSRYAHEAILTKDLDGVVHGINCDDPVYCIGPAQN
jgi:hypothetical protein